jgi:hypothetical protein
VIGFGGELAVMQAEAEDGNANQRKELCESSMGRD